MVHGKIVSKKLADNLETLEFLFHRDTNVDIVFRQFKAAYGARCFLVYLDGMADQKYISEFILRPLMSPATDQSEVPALTDIIQASNSQWKEKMDDVVQSVLLGDTAIFQEGLKQAVVCETKGFAARSVSTPNTEVVVKGSQEAFTEAIRTNITLVRRIIQSNHLVTEFVRVGELNHGLCAIMYMDNIANKKTLAEVRRRMKELKGDFLSGTGMVEQMIEDRPFSLFPSILSTERPDRVAGYLSSGRIAIVCDGSPFVIVVPVSISILLDSTEGTRARWSNGTYIRILRFIAVMCSAMLSGCYVALITAHREMIPTQLLSAIVAAQANVPFPSLLEVLLMEIAFELVREAGIRSPSALGGAIGIVGALILGQSAVEANLVSPVTLIVVALSGLSNTALPDYDLAFGLRTIKLMFIILGAMLGFLGISIGVILVLTILVNQKSFGVPMLSFQSLRWSTGSPLVFQWPLWKQHSRPRELHPQSDTDFPPRSRRWDHPTPPKKEAE